MRLRKKTVLVSLLVAVFAYSLIGILLLPAIVLHVANQQLNALSNAPARLERVEFNPFSFETTLWNLHIGEPNAPQIAFRRLYANLSLDSLWRGALHLTDIELERAHGDVRFNESGELNLLQLFNLPERTEPEPAATDSRPFPVELDRIALIKNSLYFEDQRTSEPVVFAYDDLSLELHNLSTLPDNSSDMTLTASGPYGAHLDWQGTLSLLPLRSSGHVSLNAAQLQTVWPYVHQRLAVSLQSGALSASTDYQIDLSERTDVTLSNAQLSLQDLNLDAEDRPLLRIPSLTLSDGSMDLAQRQARLGSLQSEGLEAWAARTEQGDIDLLALLPAAEPDETESNSDSESADTNAVETPAPAPVEAEPDTAIEPTEPPPPWQLQVIAVDLNNYHLHLEDRQPAQHVKLELSPLNLSLRDFDSNGQAPFQLSLDTGVNDSGRLEASGGVTLTPLSADLQVSSSDLNLQLVRAYVEPLVRIQLRSGLLGSQLQVQLRGVQPLDIGVSGDANVTQLHIVDSARKRDLLKWQRLDLSGIDYQTDRLSIDGVALQQPYVRFIINENLTTNFSGLLVEQPAASAPQRRTTSDSKAPMALRIGGIRINNGSANFADFSLTPNFATALGQLNGSIGTIDNQRPLVASVDIEGRVDRYAPVTIKGGLTPFDPLNSLDIATRFRNVELTTLTPYSGKFAGYRIRKGRLNLDLRYRIEQGQLNAENKLLLEGLQLGEKVDSPDAVDLPVRLAVALLKDTKGNIDLSLPVSGNLDNPEFSVMPIVWQTLRNLLLRATQAPFKFIAGLVSGDDQDLSQISFAPGQTALDSSAQGALDTLATALQERPALTLEIEGLSTIQEDGPPLAAARLEEEYQQLLYQSLQRSGAKVPANPSELTVEDDDKPALLEGIYRSRLKRQPPPEWAELDTDERAPLMQQAVLDHWSSNALMLRRLAQARAAEIKAYLVERGGLDAQRLYLIDVSTQDSSGTDNISIPLHLDSQ
ncbi:DUF748 domain-containing protein [Halopseudomonas pachastrellae]|uniref:DUF748 domain-containing protein n=1 Tax=Halopseudomonas pachastrellae TaxID=254161 RepID=UPI003D7D1118